MAVYSGWGYWQRFLAFVFSFALLLPLFALSGCEGNGRQGVQANETPKEKEANVTVQVLVLEDVEQRFTLPGSLEAWEDLVLAAEQSGAVRWIGLNEGDRVKKGGTILRIDPETLQANLASARAQFDLSQSRLKRFEALIVNNLVSRQEYDEAKQAFDVAEANLKVAQVALEKSTLKSPVEGVLDDLLIDRGEYIGAGDPAAVVVQVDRLKAIVDVPEKDVSYLRGGQKVELTAASMNDDEGAAFEGEIIHIAYKADPDTRTYRCKMAVDNRQGMLRPGMIVKASFLRRRLEGVIAVPMYAVIDRDGRKLVFVEQDGLARSRLVKTGSAIGDRIVIAEGLTGGERLIVKGQHLVEDGMPVTEVNN